MDTLIRITAPHFVAGLLLEKDRVVMTAPILKYMLGWHVVKVKTYARKKKWLVDVY